MDCDERYKATFHKLADKIRLTKHPFVCACIGELIGTIIFISFGLGVIVQHVLGAGKNYDHGDFLSVAFGWGIAGMLGLFFSLKFGTGAFNPAVTLAFALCGHLSWKRVIPFTIIQLVGCWLSALIVFGIYEDEIRIFDPDLLMEKSGSLFVTTLKRNIKTSLLDQIAVTAIFLAVILILVDKHCLNLPVQLIPLYAGLMVTGLVTSFALNTGTSVNPARDLGPRIALAMLGYGAKAFTYQNGYCWVSVVGPYIGAFVGAFLYEFTFAMHLPGAGGHNVEEEVEDDHESDYEEEHTFPMKRV